MTGQRERRLVTVLRRGTALAVAAAACVAGEPPGTAMAGGSGTPASGREVSYHGYRITVPRSWPIVRLATRPGTCVRFDRHALYLGHPGSRQNCPAGLRDRTEAILIEPIDAALSPTAGQRVVRVRRGRHLPTAFSSTVDNTLRVAVEGAGVLVTAGYGSTPRQVTRIIAGSRVAPGAAPAALPAPRQAGAVAPGAAGPTAPLTAARAVQVPGTFRGYGFDACAAPNNAAMDAWLAHSRFRAIGVYIGGSARACAQPNLTASWVSRQAGKGWHIFPIYVGRQAPCTDFRSRITPSRAREQGRAAGDDAANLAAALGMARGSVIIEDVEHYPRGGRCTQTVLRFLSGWTERLHERGYRSSVYCSLSSGILDLVGSYRSGDYVRPDHIDFARWDRSVTTADPQIPASYWSDRQRIKQYRGGHDETHGGVRINIDSDYLDVAPLPPARRCAAGTAGGCPGRGARW